MEISKETISLINTFKNPLLSLLSDIKDEVRFYFDTGIIRYVETIKEKYSKTKTFLYRLENINFYDVYFPISIDFKTNSKYYIENINDLFRETNFVTIIGNAGSGKSMLLKHVFLKSVMQVTKIPIVIELRNLNDYTGSFIEYLERLLMGKNLTPSKKILKRIIANGDFIFLLDGYDEIYSERKNKLTSELIEFMDNNKENYFLITSRPNSNVESIPRFNTYQINNLLNYQINDFINQQLKICRNEELALKIIEAISESQNSNYKEYFSSPLLLTMFIFTFSSYPELPRSKHKFYWYVFETLCTKHDSFTKYGGFQHERKSNLQNEDFEEILKWLAYNSLIKGKYSFDSQYFSSILLKIKKKLNLSCNLEDLKNDLVVSISIIIKDGLEYKFPHKSLQEYFTALRIKDQSDSVKKELYSNTLKIYIGNTSGGNHNLLDILKEIDSVSFKRYFIIKNLSDFLKKIDMQSKFRICESFFHQTDIKIGLRFIEHKLTAYRYLDPGNNFYMQLLEYLNIFNRESFFGILHNIFESEIGNKHDTIKIEKVDFWEKWEDDHYKIFEKFDLITDVIDTITLLQKTIIKQKEEISIIEKDNNDLLNL